MVIGSSQRSSDFILVAVSFWHLFTSPVVYGGVECCSKSSTIAIFASGVCNTSFSSTEKQIEDLKNPFYFI